jgi:hypothetical protein
MIPIIFFASVGQIADDYDGYITLGIILRLFAILYLLRLSRSIEDKSRIFGNRTVLQIFIIFFLTLTVSSFLFYKAERSDVNSQITSMGDALCGRYKLQQPQHLDVVPQLLKEEFLVA